jgi:hypothetical protein
MNDFSGKIDFCVKIVDYIKCRKFISFIENLLEIKLSTLTSKMTPKFFNSVCLMLCFEIQIFLKKKTKINYYSKFAQ